MSVIGKAMDQSNGRSLLGKLVQTLEHATHQVTGHKHLQNGY